MSFDYQSWIKAAEDRLEMLYQQKAAIDDEIAKLEHGIKSFAPLVDTSTSSVWIGREEGITDAVRTVLRGAATKFWAPTDVRDELRARGLALTQKNPMATVHQILARLAEKQEATMRIFDGKTMYQWAGELPLPKTKQLTK